MKKLTKFHFNPNKARSKVSITITDERSDTLCDVTSLQSNDLPKPELEKALMAMAQHLMDFCELPEEWADDITVYGVTASHDGGILHLMISGSHKLEYAKSPLVLNSPWHSEESDDGKETGEAELSVFGQQCVEDFNTLQARVFRYVGGERQQLVLFKEPEPEPETVQGHPAPLTLEADPVTRDPIGAGK